MDPIHTIMYKHKFTTKGKDWKAMLKRTYFWVDWFSMPQPGAEKAEEIGKKKMDVLKAEGSKAQDMKRGREEEFDDREMTLSYLSMRESGWKFGCIDVVYRCIDV